MKNNCHTELKQRKSVIESVFYSAAMQCTLLIVSGSFICLSRKFIIKMAETVIEKASIRLLQVSSP